MSQEQYLNLNKEELISIIQDREDIIVQQKRVIDRQKNIIQAERSISSDLALYISWQQKLLSNPYLTDKKKICFSAYYDSMTDKKVRPDGSRYYDLSDISLRLGDTGGNKMQSFSPIHTEMKKYGVISSYTEKQKNDPTRKNHYDIISPLFWSNPEQIRLDGHDQWGGKRAIHIDCGGLCKPIPCYECEKCGKVHISIKEVYFIDEEEIDSRIDLERRVELGDLDNIIESYHPPEIADILRESEVEKCDIETFQRAMKAAVNMPRQKWYNLENDIYVPAKEMTIEPSTGPPDY